MSRVKCTQCQQVNESGAEECAFCHKPLPRIRIEIREQPKAPSQEAVQFRRGQVVAGRYTVLDLVGRGGMGCIYRVRDNTLGEDVALKTLLPQFARDRTVVERFFNEAKITRRLSHPNVVRVHDIGNADGVIYISMEFLRGQSLRSMLDKMPQDQQLPLEQVYRIFDELCASLEYAHQYTIHRDIKPENVMICDGGVVKLMDFGISKLMANTRLTGASMVMGTPMYMPPEQLRNSRDVDARADVFSVGVMLYEVLTGNLPTGIPQPASHVRAQLPPALDDIIAQCVAHDPKARFADIRALRAALRAAREGVAAPEPAKARAKPAKPRAPEHRRRLAGSILAAVAGVAMVLGLVAAEKHRRELVPAAASGDTAAPATELGLPGIAAVIADARPRAENAAKDNPELEKLLAEAEAHWAEAEREAPSNPARALALATEALQYILAPLLWEEGMGFVPPGSVTLSTGKVDVPAFLIDSTEVTMHEYARFCRTENWRMPETKKGLDEECPVRLVTWFDAQAYALAQGKQLPADAEWARAAYGGPNAPVRYPWGETWERDAANTPGPRGTPKLEKVASFPKDFVEFSGCYDMAGGVAEWTRTPVKAGTKPDFGVMMVTRGGDWQGGQMPLTASGEAAYEQSRENLGFRCVREIPSDPASARSLLSRLH